MAKFGVRLHTHIFSNDPLDAREHADHRVYEVTLNERETFELLQQLRRTIIEFAKELRIAPGELTEGRG